ncbi:MAG: class F sortase [Ilumatobacteraceae bacterium]
MSIRPLLVLLSTALFVAGCGATDPSALDGPAIDDPAVSSSSSEPGDGGHDDDAAATAGGTTEATIAQLQAMPPEAQADAHRHHGDGHGDHDNRDHPNGVDPARIVIPAIGVDANVIDLGLQSDGTMEVPEDFAETGWFDRGPRPGRVGPAVIAGHVDSRRGPAVFFRLGELAPGDEIEVHGEDGEIVVFTVRELEQHPKDDFPTDAVYRGTPGPELRLITCSGEFDGEAGSYRDNTIVFAERVA